MINNTKMRIAKKYQHMIEEISAENDGIYTMTWAYAKPGYYFGNSGTHTENGYTQKELYKAIQTLQPCDCEECKQELKKQNEEENTIEFIDSREIEEYTERETEYDFIKDTTLEYDFYREMFDHKNISLHKEMELEKESGSYLVSLKVHFYDEFDNLQSEKTITQVRFYSEHAAYHQYYMTDSSEFYAMHLGKVLF